MAYYRAFLGGGSGQVTSYSEAGRDTASSATTHTITGLTPGKKYLALVFNYSVQGSTLAYNRFDTAEVTSGGSMTKISNLQTSTTTVAGTFFSLSATAASVTISTAAGSKHSRVILFKADT